MKLLSAIKRLFKEQPFRFGLAVAVLTLAGLLEGAGVATIVPLLDLVSANATGEPSTTGKIVNSVLGALGLPVTLQSVLAIGLFFVVAQQVVLLVQARIVWGSICKFEATLRNRLYEAVFDAGWPFFVSEKASTIINALIMEATRASQAYTYVNQLLGALIVISVYLVLAVALSWQMTLLVGGVGLMMVFLLKSRVARGSKYGEAFTRTNEQLQHESLENISGAKLVKGTSMEAETVRRFETVTGALAHIQYKAQMNQAWLRLFYDTVSITVVLAGIFLAATRFQMPLSELVVFLFVFYRISPRISNVQLLNTNVLSFLPALEKIDGIVDSARQRREREGGIDPKPFSDAIRFDHVSFAYDDEPVLHDVSIEIARGRVTALVGPSGAGKTTIMDMVMALMSPKSGEITVDGVDLDSLDLHGWRSKISYVAQDTVLFHATIAENLRWGSPDATDEQIREAAQMAFAHDFISELPEGYDTVVGDRGMRLSGGQRQRLALARALLRQPEILILDEATSALDAESEERIQQAVARLAGSISVLVVTHRLATVKDADLIYVLESGRVIEQGSFDQLVERGGRFEELTKLQSLEGPGEGAPLGASAGTPAESAMEEE